MKRLSISALTAMVLAAPLAANAQDAYQPTPSFDNRWYIAPFATYTWASNRRDVDDGFGGGLGVGKPINEWLNLELRATYTELSNNFSVGVWDDYDNYREVRVNGKNKIFDLGLDALFFFSRGRVQPYLLLGVGAIEDKFSASAQGYSLSERGWSFMAEAGAGIQVPIADYLSFRADVRYRYDANSAGMLDENAFGDVIATAGIVIPLGRRAAPPVTRKYELSADALFAFDKYNLTPVGVSTINNFANDLAKSNYTDVKVAGYTDQIGSESYNLALSDRRANTVREQLVSDGVPAGQITAQGYGMSNLKVTAADCAHAKSRAALIECYQPNRRVEVTVEGMTDKE